MTRNDNYCAVLSQFGRIRESLQGRTHGKTLEVDFLLRVMDRYQEPWRDYHGIGHIDLGFCIMSEIEGSFTNPISAKLAWLLHDVILVPRAPLGENELRSAEWAESELLSRGVCADIARETKEIILCSADHLIPERCFVHRRDLGFILDIDLYGLGEPLEQFVADGESIRSELRLTDAEWRASRAAWAEGLLMRERIFHSEEFYYREKTAQENLRWAVGCINEAA